MTPAVINVLIVFTCLLFAYVIAIVCLGLSQYKHKSRKITDHSYVIIYASQSGQTEKYAALTAQQLRDVGEDVVLLNIETVLPEHLQQAKNVIWMISTYGEGDCPDTARTFNKFLFDEEINLSHQNFAVLAFGDQRYPDFCAFGERLYDRLLQLKAHAWFELIRVNQNAAADLMLWQEALNRVTQHHLSVVEIEKNWELLTLVDQVLLNEGSQGTPLFQVIFKTPSSLMWQSGDILEIQCFNVGSELTAFKRIYPILTEDHLNELVFKNLRQVPIKSDTQSIEQWIESFEDLEIREYSIASIPAQQQLHLVVRQEWQDNEIGLGSGLLTQKLAKGQNILGNIRHNPNFHLVNQDVPAIFIGNGSGIAGLFAHLYQREKNQHYQNWLIFGERQQQFDGLFDEKILNWQKIGMLPKLDRVYSRDDGQYHYVQDVILDQQEQITTWIEQGAYIYICGSLHGMARGVEEAFIHILGQAKLDDLKNQKRYLRDVY